MNLTLLFFLACLAFSSTEKDEKKNLPDCINLGFKAGSTEFIYSGTKEIKIPVTVIRKGEEAKQQSELIEVMKKSLVPSPVFYYPICKIKGKLLVPQCKEQRESINKWYMAVNLSVALRMLHKRGFHYARPIKLSDVHDCGGIYRLGGLAGVEKIKNEKIQIRTDWLELGKALLELHNASETKGLEKNLRDFLDYLLESFPLKDETFFEDVYWMGLTNKQYYKNAEKYTKNVENENPDI